MKILQLAPRVPFPEDDGGKIGIANITRELSNLGAEVTLLYYYHDEKDLNLPDYARTLAEIKPIHHNTTNSVSRILKAFLLQHSVYIDKHISSEVKKCVRHFLKDRHFDIIHCDHTAMVPLGLYCQSILKCPIGLRLHNVEWTIWQRYADSLRKFSPSWFYIQNQAFLLKQYESKILTKMDINFAITDIDAKLAHSMNKDANITIAGAGVNPKEFLPDSTLERNPYEMIHATVYKWRHNLSAIEWFVSDVLPKLCKHDPKFRLSLLGKSAPQSLKNIHRNVDLLGYVPKVQPYLNRAGIYIAPLFVGGGIRIKILEAMAMELPIVASPIAAEGINATPADGLFIANSADEFAEYIIKLSENDAFRIASGQAARKYILNNYTWTKNVSVIFNEYKKVIK